MSDDGANRPLFRVTHVIFDIDGTLIDFAGAYEAGWVACAARASELVGARLTSAALRDEQRRASAELRAAGTPRGDARYESLRRALARVGCDASGVEAAVDAFEAARLAAQEPYPDVQPTLDDLASRGFELIAASNGNAELAQHEIFRYFSTVWLAQEVGVSKPDPEFFLGALQHAGAHPIESLMIGDRLDNDYAPARAAGMHAVLIDREDRIEDDSAMRIRTLTELPPLLEPVRRV